MATQTISFFNLKLSHLPLINVRRDFNAILALFRNEMFRRQFRGYKGEIIPVKTHYFTWHGMPNSLLTYLLRDVIVGLESAVSGAVFTEAIDRGTMRPEILEATKNPFSLKQKGTAACVYIGLPALIDPDFSLNTTNPDLWERVRTFYKEVRNPIFHAYEIEGNDPDPVWQCLELVWEIYQWLNSWHPVSKLTSGPISWSPTTLQNIESIPSLDDLRVKQIIPERILPEHGREYLDCLPDKMSLLQIEEVDGIYVGTEEMLDISMTDSDGNPVKTVMSPHAAMRLLVFLALAKEHRGWELPDRV
jgi:hypothetical protein